MRRRSTPSLGTRAHTSVPRQSAWAPASWRRPSIRRPSRETRAIRTGKEGTVISDSTERETIINRIKTLFEHTVENGCTEAEAIEAALAAQRLIARYDVTDANLASTVATAFRCRATVMRLGRGGSRKRYSFIGYQTDAEAARLAFEHLHEVGSRLATVEVRRWRREWPGYSLKGVKSSYCTGFVRGVADELERQTKALTVLVPEEVDAAYEAATTGGGTYAPRTRAAYRSAFDRGRSDGRDASRARSVEGQLGICAG